MSTETDSRIAGMEGELALPRSNGELVFAAPWEGRAFGIAVALNEGGVYQWRDFQSRLADEIDAAPRDEEGAMYYERWLASLENLLLERGLVTREELDARTTAYESGELDD